MRKRAVMSGNYLFGCILVGICILLGIKNIVVTFLLDLGLEMVSWIVFTAACIGLAIVVRIYYATKQMLELPAAFMTAAAAAGLVRIFSASWAYVFFLIPVGLLVFMILRQDELWGKIAGAALIVSNFIAGIVFGLSVVRSFLNGAETNSAIVPMFLRGLSSIVSTDGHLRSTYVAGLLLSAYSLLGVACILLFWRLPRSSSFSDPGVGRSRDSFESLDRFGGSDF